MSEFEFENSWVIVDGNEIQRITIGAILRVVV
jgi:hypothetical protein